MAQEDVPVAFFSYCREDSDFALKLAEDLKLAGAHVWIDQLDIEPGTPWDRAVEEALTNSPRMLVILSPVSVNSDNVRDEVSFALSRQKRVIPVLYRDCEVPFRLARLQHIDFRPDYGRALKVFLRALGVGQAAHSHPSSGAVAVVADEIAVSTSETDDRALQQKLEEERRLADEQAQLEEARQYAAEQGRRKKEREAAAQAAREPQDQAATPSAWTERRAREEQSRREQRAAEQARLEEEARLAAERVRLAQEEKERREAEIKARQEQLRREEEESVERKSVALEAEQKSKREAQPEKTSPSAAPAADAPAAPAAARPVATPVPIRPPVAPEVRADSPQKAAAAGPNFLSPKYLGGGAALVVALGLIFFLIARGGKEKPAANRVADNRAAETAPAQQQQPQAPTSQSPAGSTATSAGSSAAAPTTAPGQEQSNDKGKPPLISKELPKAKNPALPLTDLSKLTLPAGDNLPSAANAANSSKPANTAAASNRLRISQGVSQGMLMREVSPTYPPLARSARVQGSVVLDVTIAKDGTVKEITTKSGHPMLVPAAIDAVKKWRYQPYKLDGKPIEVYTQVVVDFTLTN